MEISPAAIQKSLVNFLRRYHLVVYVVVVAAGLAATVLTLNSIVGSTSDSGGYASTANNTSFDKDTINRINELKSRDQNNDTINFSKGRTNPFVE